VGIRRKAILAVAGTVAGIQLVGGWREVRTEGQLLFAEAISRGQQVQRALAVPCSVALANREMETLDAVVARFAEEEGADLDLLGLAILDTAGRVVAHTEPQLFGRRFSDPFTMRALGSARPLVEEVRDADGARLLLSMPIVSGLRWGTATATMSLERVDARILQRRREVILSSLGGALLAGLVLGILLSRMVLRPMELLSVTARRIADGNLDARMPGEKGRDEFGVVSRVFNEMAGELQEYTRDLEGRVARRTEELKKANAQLEVANSELEGAVGKLEHMARTDGLTGLLNHRAFQKSLAAEIRRANRTGAELTLIMLDVDHFKRYNDAHGHPAGDRVLVTLAGLLEDSLRTSDIVARYGGEEFSVILVDTTPEDAREVAEKLRQRIAGHTFELPEEGAAGVRVTISLGLASHPLDARAATGLVSMADQALYLAKEAGRNVVVSCSEVKK